MSFSYQVILRPSDVKFSEKNIPDKFNNGNSLVELKNDIVNGKVLAKNVPPIQVIWFCEKWEWYALSNRRLWVFQQLEKEGHLSYVAMNRVENINEGYVYPKILYKEVDLYVPDWDIQASNNNLKVGSTTPKKIAHLSTVGNLEKELGAIQIKERVTLDLLSNAVKKNVDDSATTFNKGEIEFVVTDSLPPVSEGINDNNGNYVELEYETIDSLSTVCEAANITNSCGNNQDLLSEERYEEELLGTPDNKGDDDEEGDGNCSSKERYEEELLGTADNMSDVDDAPNVPDVDFNVPNVPGEDDDDDIIDITDLVMKKKKESLCSNDSKRNEGNSIHRKRIVTLKNGDKPVMCVDNENQLGRKSSSLLSLSSNKSISSITRSERVISRSSGYHGYGYFHTYKTEYLDKIRAVKKKTLRHYKPYDVEKRNSSRLSGLSRCSSFSSFSDSKFTSSFSSNHVSSRIRLYSDDLGYSSRDHGRDTDSESSWKSNHVREWDLPKYDTSKNKKRQNCSNSQKMRRFPASDDRAVIPYKKSSSRYSSTSSLSSCNNKSVSSSGVNFSVLYKTWEKRRAEYLSKYRYEAESASLAPYVCGLCFKRFFHIVDLQQHCEELMHYACITCGKFFSSYAALGQHCKELGHKKD